MRRAARTRLVLIDDHLVVREGLAALLSIEPDLKVVGMAASIGEGIQVIREVEPDLVLSDLTLPGCSGGAAVRSLCEVFPGIRILVLTVHDSLETVRAAFGAGATGYVCKDSLRDEMLYAIRRVAAGGRATCFAVGDAIVRDWLERDRGGQRKVNTPLSAEDEEVLR
ncbi:MAG TPA: response regulator transcription factor, partial [Steroidobacteraceae bacterium]